MSGGDLALQPFTMRVNRLGLVPVSSSHPGVRRYRLARLEEVSASDLNRHRGGGPRAGTRGEAERARSREANDDGERTLRGPQA